MPRPRTLKITEIFPSIQGEGLRQGEPTHFIRVAGCNLRCTFCDTKYAWEGGEDLTPLDILNTIKKNQARFPADWVCLTGGEPLLQEIGELVRTIKGEGFLIQVETNGLVYRRLDVDWYTLSPKPEEYSYGPEYKKKAKEVKIILSKGLDMAIIQRLRGEFPPQTPLLLQPVSNRKWSVNLGMKLLKQVSQAGLRNIRLSVQLHKIFNFR
jgi:organic radical activating enzyme